MKERILAVVGAIALIVVAVVARGVLAGDDDSGSGGGSGGGRRPVVACSPGLEPVCEAMAEAGFVDEEFEVFDLGSDGATTGMVDDVEVDAWITWNPAGEIANFDAPGTPTWGSPVVIGVSPLVLASRDDLPDACSTSTDWSCVVDGLVALGNPSTIDGVLRAYPVAIGLQPDGDFATSTALAPLRDLYQRRTAKMRPMMEELRRIDVRGDFDSIVVTEAAAEARDANAVKPTGSIVLRLVVTPRRDGATDWAGEALDNSKVRNAIVAAGVEPGTGTLDGEPDAGALTALRLEIGS